MEGQHGYPVCTTVHVYACAVYIVNYISKDQSALLREACAEARKGNNNIRQQVRDIGSTLVNNVEISTQEAVYSILQLPLTKPSRQIVFITVKPGEAFPSLTN